MPPLVTSFQEWFDSHRSGLSHDGRGLDGREPGRPDPAAFESARFRLLICRLSPYDDVQASITHRVLLCAAQAIPGVYADLAFFPPEPDAALLRQDGIPFWLASGSKRAPAEFDALAISLSVQQEAFNLPAALRESGLRLDAASRLADPRHPWIILGGHAAGSAPFLHGDTLGPGSGGLVDAVCLGDGVAWLQEFLRRAMAAKAADLPKRDFLAALARELPGTYVPSLYRHLVEDHRLVSITPLLPDLPMPVQHRQDPMETWLQDYDGAYIPFSDEETEETLPLAAGCAYRCRFCQTGWLRNQLSTAPPQAVLPTASRFKAAMVNADLNLLASDACSIPGLDDLLDALCPLFRRVSVKSLSIASLVRHPESFRLLRKLAKHEFTFGVEGISARLRAFLGKPATAADLIRIAEHLSGGGLRQIKLFFIATGLEEERDLRELEQLLNQIHAKIPSCRLIASFMPLFLAPFTPLQFAPLPALPPHLETTLSACVRQAGGEFRWSADPEEIDLMNRLCRAGRTATTALVDFSLRRGMRYTRRLPPALSRELAQSLPCDSDEQPAHAVFPWSDLEASASPITLWRSYESARQELQAPALSPASASPAPLRSSRFADDSPPLPPLERIEFWSWIPPEQSRHPDHVIARSIFRTLFADWPAGLAPYRGNPRLLHPPGTSGLALASAEFLAGTPPPPQNTNSLPPPSPIHSDEWWYQIDWTASIPAKTILQFLQHNHVKFQTVRHETARWHIVEKAFRKKSGILALREDESHAALFCQSHAPVLESHRPALAGGVVQAILSKTAFPCPACKGTLFHPLHHTGTEPPPACFDCWTRRPKTSR